MYCCVPCGTDLAWQLLWCSVGRWCLQTFTTWIPEAITTCETGAQQAGASWTPAVKADIWETSRMEIPWRPQTWAPTRGAFRAEISCSCCNCCCRVQREGCSCTSQEGLVWDRPAHQSCRPYPGNLCCCRRGHCCSSVDLWSWTARVWQLISGKHNDASHWKINNELWWILIQTMVKKYVHVWYVMLISLLDDRRLSHLHLHSELQSPTSGQCSCGEDQQSCCNCGMPLPKVCRLTSKRCGNKQTNSQINK